MRSAMKWAAAPLAVLALAACGQGEKAAVDGAAVVEPSSRSLADSLGGNPRLAQVAGVSGLGDVLKGVGPYTVFAPDDAALATLGDMGAGDGAKAQAAQLLRAHIVPGALTRADIGAALDRAGGKPVQMRTMAEGLLTFTRDGQAIRVSADNGASAALSGNETLASNGVVQPVDGLLVKPVAP